MKVGVVDNFVELKETVTYCRITRLDEATIKDEDYKPESEAESLSDIDDRRRRLNRSSLL